MASVLHTRELDLFKSDYLLLGDMLTLFLGGNIGEGTTRVVYNYPPDKRYVIKIDKELKGFNNIREYELWNDLKYMDHKSLEFLAPIYQISEGGKWMLQRKTTPIKDFKHFPKRIPGFLNDVKIENWGMLGGKLVCHDYANNKIVENGINTNYVKPNFWSDRETKFFKNKQYNL